MKVLNYFSPTGKIWPYKKCSYVLVFLAFIQPAYLHIESVADPYEFCCGNPSLDDKTYHWLSYHKSKLICVLYGYVGSGCKKNPSPRVTRTARTTTTAQPSTVTGITFPVHGTPTTTPKPVGTPETTPKPECDPNSNPLCDKDSDGLKIEQLMHFCRGFDGRADECRSHQECQFICGDRRCDAKANVKHGPGTDCECSVYCAQPTRCKLAGCEYDSEGQNCRRGNRVCGRVDFEEWQCIRQNILYAHGGVICKNYEPAKNASRCLIEKVVTAINFNGDELTDTRRITYAPHDEAKKRDPHNLEIKGGVDPNSVLGVAEAEKPLYSTYIDGNEKKNPMHCIFYDFKIEEDGNYELIVKTLDPVWNEPGKRLFSIKLNNEILVIPELDIVSYTGKSFYGIEIVVPFQVLNDRTVLKVRGFGDFGINPNDDVSMAICYGSDPELTTDIGFVVSAFSVIKYGIGEEITCDDPTLGSACPCRALGCEFNTASKTCTTQPTSCAGVMPTIENECRRANAYYADGGVLCKNLVQSDSGNCAGDGTMWAVNLNGKAYQEPSRGILYLAEEAISNYVLYSEQNRVAHNVLENCPNIAGVSESDATNLFATAIKGNPSNLGPDNCLVYPIPVCKDGRYELSVKFVDDTSNAINSKRFKIKLNEILVVAEIDPIRLGAPCQALEIIILLEIEADMRTLKVQGHPETDIKDGQINLKFCYGDECSNIPDRIFQVSAYSLFRLGEPYGNGNPCQEFNGSPCQCKFSNECEYDSVSNTCHLRKTSCNLCDFALNECRRSDSYYANGGVLCRSNEQRGSCTMERSIIGVNLEGGYHVDVDGIPYTPSDFVTIYHAPKEMTFETFDEVEGKPQSDTHLYTTCAIGSEAQPGQVQEDCLTYRVPLEEDGNYELQIKVVDFKTDKPGIRSINFLFNGVFIVQELDVVAYSGGKNKAINIVVNFKVTGGGRLLHVKGHPPSEIIARVLFEICPGGCKDTGTYTENAFRISAFSVIKFLDEYDPHDTAFDTCRFYKGNPCGCRKAGCDFNVATEECIRSGRNCLSELLKPFQQSECRLANSFYLNGGLICKNAKQRGRCTFSKTALAVNLADEKHTDSRGIVYEGYDSRKPDFYKDDFRMQRHPIDKMDRDVPEADKKLYEKSVLSSNVKEEQNTDCLKYNIPISADGNFELAIKVSDPFYIKKGTRSFNYKLNGLYLVRELDILVYTHQKDYAMNLVVNFKVSGDQHTLHLPGYPDTTIVDGIIALEACDGMCRKVNNVPESQIFEDPVWHLSAFSVIQLGTSGENENNDCRNHDANICDCAKNSCQFDVVKNQCSRGGIDHCQHSFGLPSDCRRPNSFYTYAGTLCKNVEGSGDCSQAETAYAVNLNGVDYTSTTGIFYIAYDAALQEEIIGNAKIATSLEANCDSIAGAGSTDSNVLYKSMIRARDSESDEGQCVSYTFKICDDGRYELSLKTVEEFFNEPNKRRFNIKLAGQYVANEVDLFQLAEKTCKRIEILSLFEVTNGVTKLRLHGFPEQDIENSKIDLELCYSKCGDVDKRFQASAFSLVKFAMTDSVDNHCWAYENNPCQCIKSQCEFDSYLKRCMPPKPICARCQFGEDEDCRRESTFYLSGGRACKNVVPQWQCVIKEVIKAVNLGGEAVEVNGIDYESYANSNPFNLPGDAGTSTSSTNQIPEEEKELFSTSAVGGRSNECLVYEINLQKTAKYELVLKLWDETNPIGKRSMNIRFNGVPIAQEMDMSLLGSGNAFTLAMNFKVRSKGRILKLPGHANTAVKDHTAKLEFCPGTCSQFEVHSWMVSAFHVSMFMY